MLSSLLQTLIAPPRLPIPLPPPPWPRWPF